jgi:hypothetical protein
VAEVDNAFLTLTGPAAAGAADKLAASAASPLRMGAAKGRPAERAAAAERELAQRGLTLDGAAASPDAQPFRDALAVLAQPEALVRVRIAEPGQQPADVAMLVRQGKAAAFLVQGESVLVGPARDLGAVADSLAGEAAHQGPLSGQQIILWPATLKVLSAVWGAGRDASVSLSREEAERRLGGEGRPPETVKAALDEMVEAGVLVAAGGGLQVVSEYRPFLERVWSGRAMQVEYLPLEGAPSFEAALGATGPHLLFLGAPGDRVLSERLTGDSLRKWLKGARAAEDTAVRLAAPPPDVVGRLVRMLVGLEKPQAA